MFLGGYAISVHLFLTGGVVCHAKVGHFSHVGTAMSEFANHQLEVSYKYMLLANQFNAFAKDRPGFYAHYKALSDRSWAAGMNLIKYITKRGGVFKFGRQNVLDDNDMAEMNEFQAMATILDNEKKLFKVATEIHKASSSELYDPEVAHYIEEEYLGDLASSIRKFSGYANDLKNLYVSSKDISMDNYLYDKYLQKV